MELELLAVSWRSANLGQGAKAFAMHQHQLSGLEALPLAHGLHPNVLALQNGGDAFENDVGVGSFVG